MSDIRTLKVDELLHKEWRLIVLQEGGRFIATTWPKGERSGGPSCMNASGFTIGEALERLDAYIRSRPK